MTAEVVGWTDVILKVGIVLTLTDGFLTMMQRQIMQVVTLLAVCSEYDAFSRSTITGNYTKALAEIILSIEVIANLKLDICQRNFLYTVKRINTVIVAFLGCGLPCSARTLFVFLESQSTYTLYVCARSIHSQRWRFSIFSTRCPVSLAVACD